MENETNGIRRLFFGLKVSAPWPTDLPNGRLVEENNRHMTLVFLGNVSYLTLSSLLKSFPAPSFKVGQVGYFDKPLFLPENHPLVVAWNMNWLNPELNLNAYYMKIMEWLRSNHIQVVSKNRFLPHTTISRTPFSVEDWKEQFIKIPFIITGLHLYESSGNLQYDSCWEYPLQVPFKEFEHTADIAYHIYGENIQEIYYNAFTALAFEFPGVVPYYTELQEIDHLDDVIIHLNAIIGKADMAIGCPFKAISFHGNVRQENNYLTWEMIIDV